MGQHGRALSQLVERSVSSTNWLHAQPPRAPRPVCDLLLERLERCEAELSGLTDDGHEQGMCSIMFTDVAIHGDGAAKEAGSTVLLLLVKLCTTPVPYTHLTLPTK